MLHKYKMLPLVAVMLVMSLVFSAQAAPVVPDFVPLVQSAGKAVVNISTEKKVMQRGGMPSEMFRRNLSVFLNSSKATAAMPSPVRSAPSVPASSFPPTATS